MPWDEVEFDFGGDETCNFGPRKESGSLLYQVNTLATISNSDELVSKLPQVASSLSSKGVCVAADHQVSIFDENCQKHLVVTSFETVVEVIRWSDDGTFLIIAERNGAIHFAHSGMGRTLYSQTLLQHADEREPCFLGAELCPNEDVYNFLVLTKQTLFRFPRIDFMAINNAIKTGSMEDVKSMMTVESVDVSSVHNSPRSLTYYNLPDSAYAVTAGGGDSLLAVWRLSPEDTTLYQQLPAKYMEGDDIQKVVAFEDYIFTLDAKNVLCAFDKVSLIQIACWPEVEIKDFILIYYNSALSSNNDQDQVSMQIVAITLVDGECFLKVLSLPGMECVYSLAVGHHSCIADMPPSFETIFLIEGTSHDDDSSNNDVSILRVRCLTEALPETRFHRLLNKAKFTEAEEFAKLFGLDVQMVYKTKVDHLMKEMAQETSVDSLASRVEMLTKCLNEVSDDRFVASICCDVGLPTLDANEMVLYYAQTRLSRSQCPNVAELKTQLLAIMKELKTFKIVYGASAFSLNEWNDFLQPSVAKELIKVLKASMLSSGMALCLRHKEELLCQMDLDTFQTILNTIPANVPIPWLRDVLFPMVFRDYLDGKKLLAAWVKERALYMEITDMRSWPGNSINILQLFFSVYQSHTRIGQVYGSEDGEIMDALETLLGQLTGIMSLRSRYHCDLSLRQYTKEDVSSIAFVMLNRMAAIELLPRVLQDQVKPYAEHNHLKLDQLLHDYIALHCNMFESRSICITQYITDTELYCKAVTHLMKRAEPPWSKELENLVQATMELDHPLAEKLRANYKQLELSRMLSPYKLGHLELRYVENFKRAINNILRREEDSVMMHALQLVEAVPEHMTPAEAYVIRMKFLLKQNKVDRCFDLYHSIDAELSVQCAQKMVNYVKLYLMQAVPWTLSEEEKQERLAYCKGTIKFLQILLRQTGVAPFKLSEWALQLQETESIKRLLDEFDVFHYFNEETTKEEKYVELADIYRGYKNSRVKQAAGDSSEMSSTLQMNENNNSASSFLKTSPLGTNTSLNSPVSSIGERNDTAKKFSLVTRFGKCLGLSEAEVKGRLAQGALKKRNLKDAISVCRDLCSPQCTREGAMVIFHVLLSVCQLGGRCTPQQILGLQRALGKVTNLFKTLYELGCMALTNAHEDNICDLAELCKQLRLLWDIERQCETGDYGSAVEIPDHDVYRFTSGDGLMEEFFSEDSMVMESTEALPCAATSIVSHFPHDKMQATPYELCNVMGRPVPISPGDSNTLTKTSHQTSSSERRDGLEEGALPDEALAISITKQADESTFPALGLLPELGTTGGQLVQYLIMNNHHQLALSVAVETMGTAAGYIDGNSMSATHIQPWKKDAFREEMKAAKSIISKCCTVSENCALALLDKIFEAENVNKSLALSFLLLLRKHSTAVSKLKQLCTSAGFNYRKVIVIAAVGQDYSYYVPDDQNIKNEYQEREKLATWGQRLRNYKISFKEVYRRPLPAELEKVLMVMTAHWQLELSVILEFCRDFNLSGDAAMLLYLKQHLLPSTGQQRPRASVDDSQELDAEKLEGATREIQDRQLLLTNLDEILQKVDGYDYERISFILKSLKHLTDEPDDSVGQQLELLRHIETYKRVSPPSVTEVSQQARDDYKMSELSKDRLPFHGLLRPNRWKILSRELYDTTFEQLLPVTQLLKLPGDQVCVTTIHNILEKTKESTAAAAASQKLERGKSSVYLNMINSVKALLFRIESLQMAVATARLMAKDIPKGPEKVVAFKICILLAEKWVQKLADSDDPEREKAMVTLKYLTDKYRLLATERVLYKFNLAENKHLEQVDSPQELVIMLYQHESIVNRMKGEITSVPDIHAAAEAIANINELELPGIHKILLEKWLSKSLANQEDIDETVDLAFMNLQSNDDDKAETQEEQYLMRIRYLLKLEEPEKAILLLLKIAYGESSTYCTRLRALKCLFDISSLGTLEMVSGKTVQEIWEYLQNVSYLSDLEDLNFNLDLKTFLQANKQGLVRGMLRKYSQEPKALKLIADLSLKYNVLDINLWNCLLVQMFKFSMFPELEQVLHSISNIGELQQIPCLGKMWWNLLLQPFKTVCAPLSEEEKGTCRRSLVLLHSCPVTCDLDVTTLHNRFSGADMLPEALACLLHLPITEQTQQIKVFFERADHTTLTQQLQALKDSNNLLPESQRIEEILEMHGDSS